MRKMKNSDIKWIGEIPEDWNIIRFQNLIKNSISGEVIDKSYWNEGEELLYTCQKTPMFSTFEKFPASKRTAENDLLLTRNATPYVFIPLVNSIYSNVVQKVTIDKRWDRRYVKYAIQLGADEQRVNGDTIPSYNMDVWKNIYICKIPLDSQIRIANFLDEKCSEIDALSADIQSQIKILEEYKKSIITEAVTKGLNPDVEMKDSGIEWIGMVPKHWKCVRLKHCLDKRTTSMRVGPFGTALSGSNIQDNGVWVYNQRCVLDKNFTTNDTFISEEKFRELKSFEVFEGDILITTRGSVGKVAVVPPTASKGVLHPCIIRFVPNKQLIDSKFIEYIFNNSDIVLNQILYKSNSTTIDVIYSYSLREVYLPIMPLSEQKEIIKYLDAKCTTLDAIIADKKAQLETLTEYKKSLIYEYVTGKKEVG